MSKHDEFCTQNDDFNANIKEIGVEGFDMRQALESKSGIVPWLKAHHAKCKEAVISEGIEVSFNRGK